MKSFTKRLGPWLGRGEGIAFSEKTLKNMTDADNSLGIVVDLVIPAQVGKRCLVALQTLLVIMN